MKSGVPWQNTLGMDIEGKTLGVLGLGKLGARAAGVGKAFGMKVIAWSQNLTPEKVQGGRRRTTSQGRSVPQRRRRDNPSRAQRPLARPGRREGTRPDEEDRLSDQHVARADRRREGADRRRCNEKQIAGAGLDVFDVEPLPLDHPFRKMDNVVITPHLGYVSEQNYRKYYPDIVEDIRAWLDGKPMRVIAPK